MSGLRHPDPFAFGGGPRRRVAHPIQHIRLLDVDDAAAIGSDTVRAGWSFGAATLDDTASFTDPTGLRWTWSQGRPCLLEHPLETVGVRGVRRYPHPAWASEDGPPPPPSPAQDTGHVLVVEPPCPGMLELAMALRNPWQYLRDITDGWRVAGALLDWSLETVLTAYEAVLASLPRPPDLLVYPDEFGFRAGMYMSADDVRRHLRPRLHLLFSRLRTLCPAPILFQCRGAVGPVLPEVIRLAPDLLHLQRGAARLEPHRVRATVPPTMVLHGVVDLVRLGQALTDGDRATVAAEAVLLAQAWPAVTAPREVVAATVPRTVLAWASRFVRALTPGMIHALRVGEDPQQVLAPVFAADAEADSTDAEADSTGAEADSTGARDVGHPSSITDPGAVDVRCGEAGTKAGASRAVLEGTRRPR